MMVKKTTLLLMLVIAAPYAYAGVAVDNKEMMPPPGPYQSSTEKESQNVDKKAQMNPQWPARQFNNETPEWVKQQQAQMQQWMRQNSGQSSWQRNRPSMQRWNNQAPPRQNFYPEPNYYAPNFQQGSNYYGNRMQQNSPYTGGPVYGPGMPPPTFNQQRR